MNKPLLSICIPTYNRCTYLQNSLNSLICQKEFLDGTVEIVISDNASTDDTQKLCEEYASYFENIRYFRNPENVHDRNFPLALSRGNGLYRKLSGDKCIYRPKSLCVLCDAITRYRDTEKVLFFQTGRRDGNEGIMECKDFSQFVLKTYATTTSIDTFGLWESECEKITNNLSGCDLKLWQCQRIYEMVEARGGAILINRKYLYTQTIAGKDMSYGTFQVLYLNWLAILKVYAEKGLVSQDIIDIVRVKQLKTFISRIVFGKKGRNLQIMSKSENLYELTSQEMQALGQDLEFQKVYMIKRILLPVKLHVKNIFLSAYVAALSRRVRHILENGVKVGG